MARELIQHPSDLGASVPPSAAPRIRFFRADTGGGVVLRNVIDAGISSDLSTAAIVLGGE